LSQRASPTYSRIPEICDQCRLTTYGNHGPILAFAEDVRLQTMFLRFVDNGSPKNLRQVSVCSTSTKEGFNVHFLIRKKTVAQLAVGSEADAVTGWTKVVADRADNADDTFRIGPAKMAGRAVGVLGDHLFQWGHSKELGKNLIGTNVVLQDPLAIVINAHELYKANVIRSLKGQFRQVQNLVVIDSPHHHHIDLYRIQSGVLGCPDTSPHPVELITAGDAQKFLRLESVETDINAANTGTIKIMGKFPKQDSVGGEAEALQAGECCQTPTEVSDPLPYQWLSPRESNLGYAHVQRYLNKAEELLIRENVLMI